ncbi:MAG: hypothetical protein K2J37_00195 [Ruminococcus sp.]|nr:hypothetical protein [Ruminococcus sp.]MDE6784525.1 hypothetical protein [Ruminococcus sp.]
MAEEKKKEEKKKIDYSKLLNSLYYIGITLGAAGIAFFGYLKLTDTELFIFSRIISCYTVCLAVVTVVLAYRFIRVFIENEKKFNYMIALQAVVASVALACAVNSMAEDINKSKVNDVVKINERTSIILCEVENKSGHTQIDVYCKRGRFAKKTGEIDEMMFSVKCIESGAYNCYSSDDGNTAVVECFYGIYGNGSILIPEYDTGMLTYVFDLNL